MNGWEWTGVFAVVAVVAMNIDKFVDWLLPKDSSKGQDAQVHVYLGETEIEGTSTYIGADKKTAREACQSFMRAVAHERSLTPMNKEPVFRDLAESRGWRLQREVRISDGRAATLAVEIVFDDQN